VTGNTCFEGSKIKTEYFNKKVSDSCDSKNNLINGKGGVSHSKGKIQKPLFGRNQFVKEK